MRGAGWKDLLCFFLKGLFLTREERTAFMMTFSSTPSPAILLLLTDSSQQCIPKSSHVRMQTNKSLFNRGSSHTCTVRSSQYHLFNWSCRKTHQFRSDLITQCKAHLLPDTATARSGFPLLDFAKVVESIAWATARRLLSLNSFKGADLLLF